MSPKNHQLPERLGEPIQAETNTSGSSGLMNGGDSESQKAALSLDLLQRYMGEIRRYPVLDRDEECRFARERVAFWHETPLTVKKLKLNFLSAFRTFILFSKEKD